VITPLTNTYEEFFSHNSAVHRSLGNNRAGASAHSRRLRNVIAQHFINWGGFHPIKPIEKDTPMTNRDLFGTSPLDHIRMRRTLRKWSDLSGIPNPYEYTPDSGQVTRADRVEWEPLPAGDTQPEALGLTNISAQISSATLRKTSRSDVPSSFIKDKKATQLKAARNLVKRAQGQQKKPTSAKPLDSKPTPAEDSRFSRPPGDLLLAKRDSTATERLKGFIKTLFQ
jgi:hypothetical protein